MATIMATIIPPKPRIGSVIMINIENQLVKSPSQNRFYYTVQMKNENFLEVVKKKYPNRIFHISNVKVDGKRVAGSNPHLLTVTGYMFFLVWRIKEIAL